MSENNSHRDIIRFVLAMAVRVLRLVLLVLEILRQLRDLLK